MLSEIESLHFPLTVIQRFQGCSVTVRSSVWSRQSYAVVGSSLLSKFLLLCMSPLEDL